MAKIVNIQNINSKDFTLQDYSANDESLILNDTISSTFNSNEDYLEYFVFDLSKNILFQNITGYPKFKLLDNSLILDPQLNLESEGFTEGKFYTLYNVLKRRLFSSPSKTFYIQEISSDRTELRINTTSILTADLIPLVNEFISEINNSEQGYKDFYLNFGRNILLIANNMLLDTTNPEDPTILIKLYEPLPLDIDLKRELWVVEKVAEPIAYEIEIINVFEIQPEANSLRGPNFNLPHNDKYNPASSISNYNSLSKNTSILGSGSLLYKLNSILAEKGIELNINYTDYSDFIFFSSAKTRLENFYYKLSLIETYTNNSNLVPSSNLNSYSSGSKLIWDEKINEIITNFDGYEYYLYFESGSYSWPKSNNTIPYLNYSTTSSQAINWLSNQLDSASLFDRDNVNALTNAIPEFLRENTDNANYKLFVEMIGQHFDSIWIYLKDITNKFSADNRIDHGISKDLVAQAIKDLGINLYQNNFSTYDIYSSLLGITPSGSSLIFPNTTGSLPTPSGFEYINTYITSSNSSSITPIEDINKEIYKRIYHNLPYLLKKKGTPEGLKLLINLYGIPDTILSVKEFGGVSNDDRYDNFISKFNYEFNTTSSGFVKTTWSRDSSSNNPKTVLFRFKTPGIPTSTSSFNQSLAIADNDFRVVIEYTGSGFVSSSYSGSIPDPYNEYGTIKLISSSISSSVYLPVFDGDWWSVMVTNNNSTSSLYVKNKIYDGNEGNTLGFQASSSLISTKNWGVPLGSFSLSTGSSQTILGKLYIPFSGSFQELRFYNIPLSESKFNDYVMNPYSIEGNTLSGSQSSFNSLFFRAPLGTVLDNSGSNSRISIHPSITGSSISQSFLAGNSNYSLVGSFNFIPQTEVIFQNQFDSGIKNSINERIKLINDYLPDGSTLSQYITVQQKHKNSGSFNQNVNYIEVAFSPNDEVNNDIIEQYGYFNIGELIGDPRQIFSPYYSEFKRLRDDYFTKYYKNYNTQDYIRLIKFFDNSLFKMIKDFVPARTSLSSGIVIKSNLLDRNKYPKPRTTTDSSLFILNNPIYSGINGNFELPPPPPPPPLIFSIDTTKAGSASDTFILPLATGTTNISVDWGDGNIEDFNTSGNKTHVYSTSGTYDVRITGTFVGIVFNNGGDRLKFIDIKQWGDVVWKSFQNAFYGCANFNISATDTPNISLTNTSFSNAFRECTVFNSDISWFPTGITSLNSTFRLCTAFNQPVNNWNVSQVTNLGGTFQQCANFNQPVNNWNTPLNTTLADTFASCTNFNQDISNLVTSAVINITRIVDGTSFNQPVNNWNVSNVTTMEAAFRDCVTFNQNIGSWNVTKCTSFQAFLFGCTAFNNGGSADINNWVLNTTNNVTFNYMFYLCPSFNQPLNNWNVSKGTVFNAMFDKCTVFNQDISNWNVSNSTNFSTMFRSTAFNQNLSNWSFGNLTINSLNNIFEQSAMSTINYTDTIVGWANKVNTNTYPINVSMTTQTGRTFDTSRSGGVGFANAGAARSYLTKNVTAATFGDANVNGVYTINFSTNIYTNTNGYYFQWNGASWTLFNNLSVSIEVGTGGLSTSTPASSTWVGGSVTNSNAGWTISGDTVI